MEKGILLPIFSLPSKYGVGDFGKEAYEFIDILSENNIKYWEILPINDGGQYPYSPRSYYALNKTYISIDFLIDLGLIKNVEYRQKNSRITYDDFKEKMYKEAYSNFKKDNEYFEFANSKNIQEYALFMKEEYNQEIDYTLFLQYILDKQWKELKEYANVHGVRIIGDMPIYPDFHSSEVKYHQRYYDVKDGKMEFVSGASPDCFSAEGQKWGHPLYNFEEIEKGNFKYLIDRYKEFLKRYGIIRIDHFRAFDSYFKIPINEPAISGHYEKGPGNKFFDELFKITTSDRFIVEDLGNITKSVEELRDNYNFTKMKILQYTLNPNTKKDEYNNSKNMVVYTGNHDNNTIIGWYNKLTDEQKENIKSFLIENDSFKLGDKINEAIIKYALKSNAKYVIIPVQDILGLDESARINLPGHEFENNWSWEMIDFNEFKEKIKILNL